MNQFLQDILGGSWLERIAALISLAGIWMAVRQLILSWLFDIVSSALYFIVFYQSRFYSDAVLQLIFVLLSMYGWWKWTRKDADASPLKIRGIKKTELWISILFIAAGTVAAGLITRHFGAAFPFTDAFLTMISIAATWLTARKVIENWHLWIFANCAYVGMYAAKKLYPTSLLYFILIMLAIAGLKNWKKIEKRLV